MRLLDTFDEALRKHTKSSAGKFATATSILTVAFSAFSWRRSKAERKTSERGCEQVEEAEEARRRSEEYFRLLVQNTSDIISVIEADGTVRYMSLATERILGYRSEDQIGTNAFLWIDPEDVEYALDTFAEVLGKPEVTMRMELWVPHKDGSHRYLEHIVNNLLNGPSVRALW